MKTKAVKQLKELKKFEIKKTKQRKLKGGIGNDDEVII